MALLTIDKKDLNREVASKREKPPDTYVEQLIKLIPSEALALYIAGIGLTPNPLPEGQKIVPFLWFGFCVICVILIRIGMTNTSNTRKISDVSPNWKVVGISTISFIIYSYSMGGPWEIYSLYSSYIGLLIVIGWTFIAPIIYNWEFK